MLPLAAGALLLCERSSYADEASKAQAQKLFDEGLRLMDAGRYSEACPNFAQSQKLDPAGGTLLNLALCHEREGKTATALAEYRTALAQATRDDKKERQAFAQERIDLLAAMVPKVVLRQAEGAATPPEVSLDGEAIPHEQFGIPMPLNPGSHRMVVRENGINEREVIFVLRTGEARELKLYVPDTVGQLGVFAANEREDASPRAKVGPILGWAGAGALTVSAVTGIFAIASVAGALTPGGPVVGFALGSAALKAGAGLPQIMAFVTGWSLYTLNRMLVWEIPFMPLWFVRLRLVVSLPFPFLAAWLASLAM